jgi:hypothetical protein
MTGETTATLPEVLEDLAASRGISLEELAERADASREGMGRITAEGLRGEREDEPPVYFGNALDAVLEMSPEEKQRVVDAFAALVFFEFPAERGRDR